VEPSPAGNQVAAYRYWRRPPIVGMRAGMAREVRRASNNPAIRAARDVCLQPFRLDLESDRLCGLSPCHQARMGHSAQESPGIGPP
jgi:hypothetical protein